MPAEIAYAQSTPGVMMNRIDTTQNAAKILGVMIAAPDPTSRYSTAHQRGPPVPGIDTEIFPFHSAPEVNISKFMLLLEIIFSGS